MFIKLLVRVGLSLRIRKIHLDFGTDLQSASGSGFRINFSTFPALRDMAFYTLNKITKIVGECSLFMDFLGPVSLHLCPEKWGYNTPSPKSGVQVNYAYVYGYGVILVTLLPTEMTRVTRTQSVHMLKATCSKRS